MHMPNDPTGVDAGRRTTAERIADAWMDHARVQLHLAQLNFEYQMQRSAAASALTRRSIVDAQSVADMQCALRGEGLRHQEPR